MLLHSLKTSVVATPAITAAIRDMNAIDKYSSAFLAITFSSGFFTKNPVAIATAAPTIVPALIDL